jgi:DNA mismatch endonuclease (patch repair protein)
MGDWLTPEQRSRNMSAIRSSGTAPELALRAAIREAFPRRKVVERPALPGKPDYFLPGLKLAVFADGCFWHGCARHGRKPEDNAGYWTPKLARNKARDRRATRELRSRGLIVVRVWEHDLKASPERVTRRLARAVTASPRALVG